MAGEILSGQEFHLPKRLPKLMGIVNVTPDSFSDGGHFLAPEQALSQAQKLRLEGADILDIGAESTRPGFTPLSAQAEIERLRPLLPLLQAENLPFSIDTYKSETALFALSYGAEMVNDVGGLQKDPLMAQRIGEYAQKSGSCPSIIIMQSLPAPSDQNLQAQFEIFFEKSLLMAEKAGLPKEKLILDPGIGFGKTPAQNLECLTLIPFLKKTYQLPVLIGLSRKRFLAKFSPLPQEPCERLSATLGADIWAVFKGADFLRVHDILPHRTLFNLFETLSQQESFL